MRTLRARFILSHVLPTLFILPIVALTLIYLLERQVLLTDLADDLTERALFIAEIVNQQPGAWQDPDLAEDLATKFGPYVDGTILILDAQGDLLGSNNPGFLGNQDSIDLEGIEQALAGEVSILMFYSFNSLSAEVLLPIMDVNQNLVGIIGVTQALRGVASEFIQLRWIILGILGIELLIAIVVGVILALRLEKPITRASRAVIEVSKGELIDPIEVSGPSEIRRLSEAVNTLLERLRLLEDTRRQLLANIVHELGRPLGAIKSAIHVLRQGAVNDVQTREELLEGIEDEVTRMQPLLDDLAQLHGVVLGHVGLSRQIVSLSDWLPSMILPWRAAALDKGLEWSADISPSLPFLAIDPDRIGQVIGNLLSNAIKYTPEGGKILIEATSDQTEVLITVSDTGLGINPDEQERVFEPFFRSSFERRFPQGLGLGLTIARDLVEAHGGWLEVSSKPGEGSIFVVHLPIDFEPILWKLDGDEEE
jgi:signal transduction histidine kinase